MIPSFFRRLGKGESSPGSSPHKVQERGAGPLNVAHASPSNTPNRRQGASQPQHHVRDPRRPAEHREQPTCRSTQGAACVHVKGDSLKEAVVVRCLKSVSPSSKHHAQKRKLIEKYALQKANDVSITLSAVPQENEKLMKDAMAQAIAETLMAIVADDNCVQMDPPESLHQAAGIAHGCESTGASDNEQSNVHSSRTSNTSASSRKIHLDLQSSSGSCQSSASVSQPPARTAVQVGTPSKANTPKVLRVEDYQCFFCGCKGSKHLVRLRGGHHAQGELSATFALIPRVLLCDSSPVGRLWQPARRQLHIIKHRNPLPGGWSGATTCRSSSR